MEEQKTGGNILAAMLRLAGKLESDGQLHQACELYFKILDSSGETSEAEAARKALLAIAYDYERKGLVHMALDLYEKLSLSVAIVNVNLLLHLHHNQGRLIAGRPVAFLTGLDSLLRIPLLLFHRVHTEAAVPTASA